MIENLGKGAVRDIPDARDYKAEEVFGAVSVDFNVPYNAPVPPDTDQGSADSCVGHGSSSYHWQFTNKRMSVRSVFAYIAQAYGASIRDGVAQIVKAGQETFEEKPDPIPETPQNMRDRTGLDPVQALQFKEANYFALPQNNIDGVAWGIKNYLGVVFGLDGDNTGWQNMEVPEPPKGDPAWAHCLYAMGYHMHQNPDGTQEKCIICKSSWCNFVKEHHIRERYFTTGNTFNAWTLIPKSLIPNHKPMYQLVLRQDGKTYGVRISSPNGDQIIYATDEAQYRSWNKADSYQLPTVNADGTTNWSPTVINLPF